MDNGTTAMTGHQPHSGNAVNGMGEMAAPIKIEELVGGLGVKHIEVVNPNNLDETKKAFERALEYEGVSVVIARAPCILLEIGEKRKKGKKIVPYEIDREKCVGCMECISKFGCPAFYLSNGEVHIDSDQCNGCGVCQQVCKFGAIRRKREDEQK
jgi:indolepyruvate ferredoxin oxidoreductase alpha subunit